MENGINRVEIKDFLVFKGEFTADFCPGVNVLIGSNGTGKTTLLKVMYALLSYSKILDAASKESEKKIGGLYHGVAIEKYFNNFRSFVSETTWGFKKSSGFLTFSGDQTGDQNSMRLNVRLNDIICNELLIPAKDILEHSKGLLALNNLREIPFDQTYIDILSNAELGVSKEISKSAVAILKTIKNIIGGEVEYENDTFYIVKRDGQKVPFSLEASGFRKLGLLWKLLRNGLLESGTILFWDEPENSLNPELIPTLVDILLELQRGGVQIFIATHSYDVARWFELNKKAENSLRYFNLSKTDNGIVADVADDYVSLANSVIEDAGDNLLRRVAEVAAEKAGVSLK